MARACSRRFVRGWKQCRAGQQGHAALLGNGARRVLQAEIAQLGGRGTNEHDAASGAGFGKCGALTEEPIARVNRLRARAEGGVEQRLHREITLRRGGRTDLDRFIRRAHMQRVPVRRRVDGHRRDAHAPQGADDAAGDGAAIGDENFAKHQFSRGDQISTCTGVGSYALQGLLSCGQLLMAARTSVSARISTYFRGRRCRLQTSICLPASPEHS